MPPSAASSAAAAQAAHPAAAPPAADAADAAASEEPAFSQSETSCWVCFADEVADEAVLLHCGHAGLCLACADNLWRRRLPCPMCRKPIALIARVGDLVTVDGKLVATPKLPPREQLSPQVPVYMPSHDDDGEV